MLEWLAILRREWRIIKAAPFSFIIVCVVVVVACVSFFHFSYKGKVDDLNEDVTHWHNESDYYRVLRTTMLGLEQYLQACGLEESLLHLIKLRASQINGCAYCLDMHWKDLRAIGESEQRLYSLDAWRECPFYSARERAALAWTEALTRLKAVMPLMRFMKKYSRISMKRSCRI